MNTNYEITKYIVTNAGVKMPRIIYGTAWKKEKTAEYVKLALEKGFIGIDTACQPKHYYEQGSGKATTDSLLKNTNLKRSDLFIQTKYTPLNSQDPNDIPYNKNADFVDQVEESIKVSFVNLNTDYIDSYILHCPFSPKGLTHGDIKVWETMERLKKSGKVKQIGVSNFGPFHLTTLINLTGIIPSVVQNRCFARNKWDKETRMICYEYNIIYQGFSLLTVNEYLFKNETLQMIAKKKSKTPQQVIFRFAMQIGMAPLTGTTSETHMKEDLNIFDFELDNDEILFIENIADNYKFNN